MGLSYGLDKCEAYDSRNFHSRQTIEGPLVCSLKTKGDCAFSVLAARQWKKLLLQHQICVCHILKTYIDWCFFYFIIYYFSNFRLFLKILFDDSPVTHCAFAFHAFQQSYHGHFILKATLEYV